MNYLLDTHTFLWLVFDSRKLSKPAKDIIQNRKNSISVSVITFWEISLKYRLGKLVLKNCAPEDLLGIAQKVDLEILSLSANHAIRFYQLPKKSHKDPFDRMLLWQAIQNELIFITKDKDFAAYQDLGLKTLW